MCLSSLPSWCPGRLAAPAGLTPLSFLSARDPGCAQGQALSGDHMTGGESPKEQMFLFQGVQGARGSLGEVIKYSQDFQINAGSCFS